MTQEARDGGSYRILHAVVGHKFPYYFSNAVDSVRLMTGSDDILVVDNASNLPELTRELQSIAARDPRVRLLLRETNDLSHNRKVGGLYDAYNEVVTYAMEQGYDYLHIMQHDMQMLWWDESVMVRAREIYTEHPECVNIHTLAIIEHNKLTDEMEFIKPKLARLKHYGLTDTGIYDLTRWRSLGMRFDHSEAGHGLRYLSQGLSVICHPTPAVAFIPWPAVVRNGRILGREVRPLHQFLLRPLDPAAISRLKETTEFTWLEEICIPWGWTCLLPYWPSDLRTIYYWVYRYRDIRARGLRAAWPRWERRGLPPSSSVRRVQRRPRCGILIVAVQGGWYILKDRISPAR